MFTKKYPILLLTLSLCLGGAIVTLGQTTGPVRGVVLLRKADGTEAPVADATVDAYRTDISKGQMPSAKTNKKGEFSFVGMAFGQRYALAVSGTGVGPRVRTDVKPGDENVQIIVSEGDGKKLTEAEVREVVAASAGVAPGEVSETQRKQQEEFAKKNEEIKAKNAKIQQGDEIARASFQAGAAALNARNWDVAVTEFDKGVAAVPDFVGSTPALLDGKLVALKNRGFEKYKQGTATTDGAARKASYDAANVDYEAALAAFDQAMAVIKAAPAAANPNEQKQREMITLKLLEDAVEVHRLKAVSKIDTSKGDQAATVVEAYIAAEPDAAKKVTARKTLGDIYRSAYDFDKAIAAYKAVLETSPDNQEVMAMLGLSLVGKATLVDPPNRDQMQEGLNYMAKYAESVQIAPNDPQKEFKESVISTVKYLQEEQKLKPQGSKSTPARKKS